jgi:transcriptional regulator with XRE-family HTH domain
MTPPAVVVRPALNAFAGELRAARIHAGMSKSQLARRARMTCQGLIKIENGGNVSLGAVILLAEALRCQVSDFFPRKAPWNDHGEVHRPRLSEVATGTNGPRA